MSKMYSMIHRPTQNDYKGLNFSKIFLVRLLVVSWLYKILF